MKTAIIGAGNVGASCAMRIVESGISDVVLVDVVESIAKGKAEDLMDAASLIGHRRTIIGTSDYKAIEDCDIVIITAGFARKPGMSREELLSKNAGVVKEVAGKISRHIKDPIIIVVTNPLDIMAYIAYKESGLKPQRVFGMAGILDTARMSLMVSRILKKPLESVESVVLGTHGETMIPLLSQSKVGGKKLNETVPDKELNSVSDKTRARGAEIVSYLGTGSAFYAPSAGVFRMAKAVVEDTSEIFCTSCLLNGEYGIKGVYLGVPAVIGRDGIKKIIELPLSADEKRQLAAAYASVSSQIDMLGTGLIRREPC